MLLSTASPIITLPCGHALQAMKLVEAYELEELRDSKMSAASEEAIVDFADLALDCIKSPGTRRPTMKDVAYRLSALIAKHCPDKEDEWESGAKEESASSEGMDVSAVPSRDVSAVSSRDVSAVSSRDVSAVSSRDVSAVSSRDVSAVSSRDVSAVSSRDVSAVSSRDVSAVSSRDVSAVSSRERERSDGSQSGVSSFMHIGSIGDGFRGWLHLKPTKGR
ncbi:unnamed protein product [Closterium sp. Naga37s-1]|nr:unnamed protein product [Closterium sp. Naga37s-1]